MIFASGFPSTQELTEMVKQVSGIQPLPIPTGIVEGTPTDQKNWKELPLTEAQKMAAEDNAMVERRLQQLSLEFAEKAMRAAMPWAPVKELGTGGKSPPDDTANSGEVS